MKKLTILQGPPAAGKSSLAREIHKKDKENTIIVRRDSIRESLGTYWIPAREPLVLEIERSMVNLSLSHGYHVIVDNTNMENSNVWKELAKLHSCPIEFIHLQITKEESLIRNKGIGRRQVPDEFIEHFFKKYYNE